MVIKINQKCWVPETETSPALCADYPVFTCLMNAIPSVYS